MEPNHGYPALRALFERAFSGGRMRRSLERLGQVSADEASCVAAEIRELLVSVRTERDLRGIVLQELGCGYDPRSDGDTVKDWLGGLMRHCDAVQLRSEHGNYDGVSTRAALRWALAPEIARIGVEELSIRTMVPPTVLLAAARGAAIDKAARRALSFYRFGSYPDLGHLLGGYFYQGWDFGRSWQEVVDDFLDEAGPGRRRGTAVDLDRLLETDDATFNRVLDAVGGENIPRSGSELRGWLMELRARLVARIDA
jgi:hypothetical protein